MHACGSFSLGRPLAGPDQTDDMAQLLEPIMWWRLAFLANRLSASKKPSGLPAHKTDGDDGNIGQQQVRHVGKA